MELQRELDKFILGDFNNPLSEIDRFSRQRFHNDIVEFNRLINQLAIMDMYRLLHAKIEIIFELIWTFTNKCHIAGH